MAHPSQFLSIYDVFSTVSNQISQADESWIEASGKLLGEKINGSYDWVRIGVNGENCCVPLEDTKAGEVDFMERAWNLYRAAEAAGRVEMHIHNAMDAGLKLYDKRQTGLPRVNRYAPSELDRILKKAIGGFKWFETAFRHGNVHPWYAPEVWPLHIFDPCCLSLSSTDEDRLREVLVDRDWIEKALGVGQVDSTSTDMVEPLRKLDFVRMSKTDDPLSKAIDQARELCADPYKTSEVWPHLFAIVQEMEKSGSKTLKVVNNGFGIEYRPGYGAFKRGDLAKRLKRCLNKILHTEREKPSDEKQNRK